MYVASYLQSALHIIDLYRGDIPFAAWLKQYFKNHKKYGSRDRKHIAHLCYCYYRLGKAFISIPEKERLTIAVFLCSAKPDELLEQLAPLWNRQAARSTVEKLQLLQAEAEWHNLFPWQQELPPDMDAKAFSLSFLVQPDIYLRLRPGKEEEVKRKLQQAHISFYECSESCLGLPSSVKADAVIQMDKEAVVQDRNSQQTLHLLFEQLNRAEQPLQVWDCCAASGGKSILLKDYLPHANLIVSDIRESILINLKKRFERAGITNYQSFVADLRSGKQPFKHKADVVICDVPCTGSGTWSRTPEQTVFFKTQRISEYAARQKNIVSHAARSLKPEGYLVYITCSVFRQENEEVVQFIQEKLSLTLKGMQYLKGYTNKADTLFSALFQKSQT